MHHQGSQAEMPLATTTFTNISHHHPVVFQSQPPTMHNNPAQEGVDLKYSSENQQHEHVNWILVPVVVLPPTIETQKMWFMTEIYAAWYQYHLRGEQMLQLTIVCLHGTMDPFSMVLDVCQDITRGGHDHFTDDNDHLGLFLVCALDEYVRREKSKTGTYDTLTHLLTAELLDRAMDMAVSQIRLPLLFAICRTYQLYGQSREIVNILVADKRFVAACLLVVFMGWQMICPVQDVLFPVFLLGRDDLVNEYLQCNPAVLSLRFIVLLDRYYAGLLTIARDEIPGAQMKRLEPTELATYVTQMAKLCGVDARYFPFVTRMRRLAISESSSPTNAVACLRDYDPKPSTVVWVDTVELYERCINTISQTATLLGVDCEWKPTDNYLDVRLAVMQLAIRDHVYLVDVPLLKGYLVREQWQRLCDLFCDAGIKKVGFGLENDWRVISAVDDVFLQIEGRAQNVCDMKQLCDLALFEFPEVFGFYDAANMPKRRGLANYIELGLGVILDKGCQLSNWAQRPLSDAQFDYAGVKCAAYD